MSGAVVSLKAHGFFDCMRRWWNLFEMAQAYARDLPLIAVATVRSHRTGSQTPTCFKIEESFGHVWGGKTDMIHGFWGPGWTQGTQLLDVFIPGHTICHVSVWFQFAIGKDEGKNSERPRKTHKSAAQILNTFACSSWMLQRRPMCMCLVLIKPVQLSS